MIHYPKKLSNLTMKKILVVIITRGNDLHLDLVMWLLLMQQRYQRVNIVFFQSPFMAWCNQARLQKCMLQNKQYKYVLHIDSDISPDPWVLETLYRSKRDIVGVPAWHSDNLRNDLHTNINVNSSKERNNECYSSKTGIIEVKHISLASILISSKVFETFKDEPLFMTWDSYGIVEVPSDVVFCKKVLERGFKIYVNFDVKNTSHNMKVKLNNKLVSSIRKSNVWIVNNYERNNLYIGG